MSKDDRPEIPDGPEEPTEQDEHLVTLQDEDGRDVTFDHLMTVEYKGASYILLEAQQDMEDCLQGESILLKIEQDENGDDVYATIEDEDEYRQVFQKCLDIMDKEDEEDDGEGGE